MNAFGAILFLLGFGVCFGAAAGCIIECVFWCVYRKRRIAVYQALPIV